MKKIKLELSEDLKNLPKASKVLSEYAKNKVKVGVLGGNHPISGKSFAEIGIFHEFGSVSDITFMYKGKLITVHGVPARSFIRVPFKKFKANKEAYIDSIKLKILDDMQKGEYTGKAYSYAGQEIKVLMQDEFINNNWVQNKSKEYIDLKGSSTPLIDTGSLVNSINYEVVKKDE